MNRLENRTALVTGAAQGIGRAIAHGLAAEGATVTIVDLNAEKGAQCAASIVAAGGSAKFVQADITNEEAITEAVTQATASNSTLDVLVNNAQFFPMPKALELVSIDDWARSEAAGPRASFRLMQLAFPYLRASGHGSIINVTSGAALGGIKFTGPYAAAKGAILALTKVAANEWAQHNIRVNAISPFALTDNQEPGLGTDWDLYTRMAAMAPMGRGVNLTTEMGPTAAFLASDDAGFITGSVFHLDGGLMGLSAIDYTGFPGIHEA